MTAHNHNEDEFDNLLDHALSEYRDAEPLAGIEPRILARLQAQSPERHSFWWIWGAIATCVALMLIGLWIGVKKPTPPKEGGVGHPAPVGLAASEPGENAPVNLPPSPVIASAAKSGEVRSRTTRSSPVMTQTEPVAKARPAVFPSPTPLSAEERAFLAALNQSPNSMPVASEPDTAITIAEIEIKPLSISGVPSSENPGEKQ